MAAPTSSPGPTAFPAPTAPPPSPRFPGLAAGLVLAAAVVLVAPWRMVDPDGLTHVTVGRLIVASGAVPRTDPLTFAAPRHPWSNPEWLGDVLWYGAWRVGGEAGTVALKLLLVVLGFALALRLARRLGATPGVALGLLLVALPAGLARFTERNHLHAYWLIPACGLLLQGLLPRGAAPADMAGPGAGAAPGAWRPRLAALAALMVLWANLHGSFPLAVLLLVAALAQAAVDRRPGSPALGAVVALLVAAPLLGMVSPLLHHNYGQLVDHLTGAAVYRRVIVEWQPAGAAPTPLMHLPLHLLGVLGLLSFLPRVNRREVGAMVLVGGGLALGYASQRFIVEMALLVVPPVAANLTRSARAAGGRQLRILTAAILAAAAIPLAVSVWGARWHGATSVLARPGAPRAAARRLAAEPAGSRVVAPFDAGPWLLWESRGRFSLYLDPRNSLGAAHLRRFLDEILPHPERFEAEAARLHVTHALVDRADSRCGVLAAHLAASSRWGLLLADGPWRLYRRRTVDAAARPAAARPAARPAASRPAASRPAASPLAP